MVYTVTTFRKNCEVLEETSDEVLYLTSKCFLHFETKYLLISTQRAI